MLRWPRTQSSLCEARPLTQAFSNFLPAPRCPRLGGGQLPRTDVDSLPSHLPPAWPPQARLFLLTTAPRHVCPLVMNSTTRWNWPGDRETRTERPNSVNRTKAGRRLKREKMQRLQGPEHTARPGPRGQLPPSRQTQTRFAFKTRKIKLTS